MRLKVHPKRAEDKRQAAVIERLLNSPEAAEAIEKAANQYVEALYGLDPENGEVAASGFWRVGGGGEGAAIVVDRAAYWYTTPVDWYDPWKMQREWNRLIQADIDRITGIPKVLWAASGS